MPTTLHHRVARAPVQRKFPDKTSRRKLTRCSLPALSKKQSTLTQIDFYSSPPRSSRGPQWPNNDLSDDESQDFMDSRPAKRQKRYGKGKQSTTCTQLWRPFLEGHDDSCGGGDGDDDGDGDGNGDGDDSQSNSPPKRSLRRTRRSRVKEESTELDADDVQNQLDTQLQGHLWSDQVLGIDSVVDHPSSTSSSHRSKRTENDSSPANRGDHSTRPSTATSNAHPSTPPKPRRTEVPSSQTPSSITLSKHNQEWNELDVRSPLKEKSRNISTVRTSPDFDHLETFDDFELVAFKTGPADAAYPATAQPVWTAKLAITPKKLSKHKEISLERKSTIPDSEADSLELAAASSPTSASVIAAKQMRASDEGASLELPQSQPRKATRTFERVTTIQESESEPELDDVDDVSHYGDQEGDHEAGEYDDMKLSEAAMYDQNTYDPVASALDRDAARYGKTSTQIKAEPHSASISQFYHTQVGCPIAEDVEQDDDDLDEHHNHVAQIIISSQPEDAGEVVISSQPEEVQVVKASQEEVSDYGPSAPGDGNAAIDSPKRAEMTMSKLTSQLPLFSTTQTQRRRQQARPSQVSTVVPSQWSRPGTASGSPSSSPQGPRQLRAPDTISSSPFPLPPWGTSQMPQRHDETQDSLVDWSLPPPPPLPLSSKRRDTTSSL